MNDIKRPKQKVTRQVKRSNIALDEYMFDRKMQSLYYGAKPKSDDLPRLLKVFRRAFRWTKKEVKAFPGTVQKLFTRLKSSVKKYPVGYLSGTLALCLLVIFLGAQLSHYQTDHPPASQPAQTNANGSAAAPQKAQSRIPLNQTPEFPVVLPQGKTAEDLGGWAKVSPPNAPPTYAYKDKIGTVEILVSEQTLPEGFKTDTGTQVEKLAVGFNATQSVKTEKVQFFLGSNTDGEQSVITYNKTLLIFLKSSAKVTNERWQTYIETLK